MITSTQSSFLTCLNWRNVWTPRATVCVKCLRVQETTISLLSLIVAYMRANPSDVTKLIYCSRTIPEIEKVLSELKQTPQVLLWQCWWRTRLKNCRFSIKFKKKWLCIHPEVKRERDGKIVDGRCHSLIAPHVRERRAQGNDVQVCDVLWPFWRSWKRTKHSQWIL